MTAGLWRRYGGDTREYTRAHKEGRGPVLCMETACACLTAEWIYASDDEAPDLEAQQACTDCNGGWRHRERDAFDLWKLLTLNPAPCDLLAELATVRRLAGYGIRWRDLSPETGSPMGPLWRARLYPWERTYLKGARAP